MKTPATNNINTPTWPRQSRFVNPYAASDPNSADNTVAGTAISALFVSPVPSRSNAVPQASTVNSPTGGSANGVVVRNPAGVLKAVANPDSNGAR